MSDNRMLYSGLNKWLIALTIVLNGFLSAAPAASAVHPCQKALTEQVLIQKKSSFEVVYRYHKIIRQPRCNPFFNVVNAWHCVLIDNRKYQLAFNHQAEQVKTIKARLLLQFSNPTINLHDTAEADIISMLI